MIPALKAENVAAIADPANYQQGNKNDEYTFHNSMRHAEPLITDHWSLITGIFPILSPIFSLPHFNVLLLWCSSGISGQRHCWLRVWNEDGGCGHF